MSHPLNTSLWNDVKKPIIEIIGLLLCLTPLFAVTIKGWTSFILIICFFICLIFLSIDKNWKFKNNRYLSILIFILALPVLVVAISSTLRNSFHLSEFDSPIRFFLAIPVLLFVIKTNFNSVKILQFTIPLALIITISQQFLTNQPMHWGPDRMATYFSDPLVFGYFSLTLGLISLASIDILKKDGMLIIILKIIGFFIGLYLSIKSGSRTGWLAIPIVFLFLLHEKIDSKKISHIFYIISLACLSVVIIYFISSTVQSRINLTLHEITNYQWSGIAPDTSVGLRITFLRMAWDIFLQSPWIGFGDIRFEFLSIPPAIYGYASKTALDTAFQSGFHNEMVTNTIRSGIFGLFSSITLFAIPFFIFKKNIKSTHKPNRVNSIFGMILIICMFSSSLSTEIFDLKYTASFYALMIALLCGSSINNYEQR